MTDFSISLPAKRRRGRPRKDGNLSTTLRTLETPTTQPTFKDSNNAQLKNSTIVDDMVGSMIYGTVEGSFDAGYLISVKIGNDDTPFRGVVFQPKKIVPLTTANDVAPRATMYQRQEIKVPLSPLPQKVADTQTLKQPVFQPVSSANESYYNNQPAFMMSDTTMLRTSSVPNIGGITTASSPTPKVGSNQHSPRVVHHIGEVMMQEFQASSPTRGPEFNAFTHNKQSSTSTNVEFHHNFMEDAQGTTMNRREMDDPMVPKDIYYSGETRGSPSVDFHQDLFTGQSQPNSTRSGLEFHQSPNLKFDLSSTVHEKRQSPQNTREADRSYFVHNEMKSPTNLGYHHALVSGNPLLLPPEFSGEPLEFMLEKNQPHPENKAHHGTSTEGASSPSDPYKLELATPRAAVINGRPHEQTINSNCITDMDFVLSDVVQHTEHQGEHCETKNR